MKNIKVSETAHHQLKKLSVDAGCSMGRLVEAIIRRTMRQVDAQTVTLSPVELIDSIKEETTKEESKG